MRSLLALGGLIAVLISLSATQSLAEISGVGAVGDQVTHGNSVELLRRGEEFYPRRLELIRGAQSSIELTTFQFCNGEAGEKIAHELVLAQARGVDVKVLIDGFNVLPHRKIYGMLKSGALGFQVYNRIVNTHSLRDRLHAKMMIVDGSEALIGGANLCNDYMIDQPGEPSWHDFELDVRGPVVAQARQTFEALWWAVENQQDRWFKKRRMVAPSMFREPAASSENSGTADAIFMIQEPFLNRQAPLLAAETFTDMIDSASESIVIYKPYLILDSRVEEAILRAAINGVTVRIFTNSLGNSRLPDTTEILAAYSFYPRLLAAGVHIYEAHGRTMHGKAILVDRRLLAIGSHDMTPRAIRSNIEDMLIVDDPKAIEKFARASIEKDETEFTEVFADDFKTRNNSWWKRFSIRIGAWTRHAY